MVATKKTIQVREFAKDVFEQAGFKDVRFEGKGLVEKLVSGK